MDGEQAMANIDDALLSCTPEIYIMLLTYVIPINLIKKKEMFTGLY